METMELERESTSVTLELQRIVENHLRKHPHLSLNGLSKRCGISEPTLRRLSKGQLKCAPSATVLAKLLQYITKSSDVTAWQESFPGPIAELISQILPTSPHKKVSLKFSDELNERLKHPTTFLIYSLAATKHGVQKTTVLELFGDFGLQIAEELVAEEWLDHQEGGFLARIKDFTLGHDHFVTQFKALANFIKVNEVDENQLDLSPHHHMMTNGLSTEGYKKIRRIQARAIKQMAEVMFAPENEGPIPTFILLALDSLSPKSAADQAFPQPLIPSGTRNPKTGT